MFIWMNPPVMFILVHQLFKVCNTVGICLGNFTCLQPFRYLFCHITDLNTKHWLSALQTDDGLDRLTENKSGQ